MSGTSPIAGAASSPAKGRLALSVGGHVFDRWTMASVTRDLRDISGGFRVSYLDTGRAAAALSPDLDPAPPFEVITAGMACTVALDGEQVMEGWIDEVDVAWEGERLSATISGRDKTGDLADCAASPYGPTEWTGLDAVQIAQAIAAPFGIAVRADVDVGAVFTVFATKIEETALIAIEKAARQRALLMVSDGVGGLLLTVGGKTRAPAMLTRPGNIAGGSWKSSWRQRYSDYFVKGQTNRRVVRAATVCALNPTIDPTTAPVASPAASATVTETVSTVMTGHVIDPEVTRWRPNVRGVKTQSGTSSVQAQAEWALRVARGMSEGLSYSVLDWRAGEASLLWRLNQLVRVSDAWAQVNRTMLIAGVTYALGPKGVTTHLQLAGRTAFERIDEPAQGSRYIFHSRAKAFGPTRQG